MPAPAMSFCPSSHFSPLASLADQTPPQAFQRRGAHSLQASLLHPLLKIPAFPLRYPAHYFLPQQAIHPPLFRPVPGIGHIP